MHRAKEERKIPHTIKRMETKLSAHILRRNCLLKHVIEGKIERRELRGRRGRRRKQQLYDVRERRGYG